MYTCQNTVNIAPGVPVSARVDSGNGSILPATGISDTHIAASQVSGIKHVR